MRAVLLTILAVSLMGPLAWAQGKEPPFVYNDHGKRDPFWKLVNSGNNIVNYDDDLASTDIILQGIMVEPDGKNVAIINGKIVKINDKVGPYTITQVEKNSVMLQKGEEKFTLTLKKEE